MWWSIYPTDTAQVQEAVLDQAAGRDGLLFTSLHLPEADGLARYGHRLRQWHDERGVRFCADISPLTLDRLGTGALDLLRDWGLAVLRIDFGFDAAEIHRIAEHTGCRIAVNASTVTGTELDALAGLPLVGWHNFYPRPETGLSREHLRAQDALLIERGIPLVAFVPGETSFRAPLGVGLPTLEEQRHRTVWRNVLQWRRWSPTATLVCAEGTVAPQHLEWIDHLDHTGEVTVPLMAVDPAMTGLFDRPWRLRVEGADAAFRLEESRGGPHPAHYRNGDTRARGSLQVDLDAAGRYRGEVHLMREDRPLHPWQAQAAEIPGAYRGLVAELVPGDRLRFVPGETS